MPTSEALSSKKIDTVHFWLRTWLKNVHMMAVKFVEVRAFRAVEATLPDTLSVQNDDEESADAINSPPLTVL